MTDPFLEVGALVRHPDAPEWGFGQVQSITAHRITVNFEHAGKVVLQASGAPLEVVAPDPS